MPKGETEIASTAGAGSLVIEFEALSSLTGDPQYGDAAYAAIQALYVNRESCIMQGQAICWMFRVVASYISVLYSCHISY